MKEEAPSRAAFERWAKDEPDRLLSFIKDPSSTYPLMTFALETFGLTAPSEVAVPVLLEMLDHMSALIREGAVYGLAGHTHVNGVVSKVVSIATYDPSDGVRSAANELLENL